MSNMTHTFNLNLDATEHHLISSSPNLTITSKGAAGEENVFMASKWGAYNHVEGFETGKDKIKIPLEVIQEVKADTAFTKGACPAAKFKDSPDLDDVLSFANNLLQYSWTEDGGDSYKTVALLTLDGDPAPTVVAADIEIV